MADGALLNRYWDDNDTRAPSPGLTTSKPPKTTRIVRQPRSIATCALRRLRLGFQPRWMDNPQQLATIRTTSIVPVDLNALMFHLEKTLARASGHRGQRRRYAVRCAG
jgi:alpha,alpha-trehalase